MWNTHKEEMPVSDRTLYTYINSGLLDADNFDLRRKYKVILINVQKVLNKMYKIFCTKILDTL